MLFRSLKAKVVELVCDWGAFLDFNLYRDAICFFLGGPEVVCRRIRVYSGDRLLGEQEIHLLTSDTAFAFSAVTSDGWKMEEHQRRFLSHTSIRHIQWINLNHHTIEFVTITK